MVNTNSVDSVTTEQEREDRQAASLEQLILSNALMKSRKRLSSTMSGASLSLEVWSYDDMNWK